MMGKPISQMDQAEILAWEQELLRKGQNPTTVNYPKLARASSVAQMLSERAKALSENLTYQCSRCECDEVVIGAGARGAGSIRCAKCGSMDVLARAVREIEAAESK